MCWGIFPFLVPCLSCGVIWADSEQPVRVKYVSNPSCGLFKDRVSCVLGLLPQKLIIFLSRCIKACCRRTRVCPVCVSLLARLHIISQEHLVPKIPGILQHRRHGGGPPEMGRVQNCSGNRKFRETCLTVSLLFPLTLVSI